MKINPEIGELPVEKCQNNAYLVVLPHSSSYIVIKQTMISQVNLNEIRIKKKKEKEARLEKKRLCKVWFDNTPKTPLPDRCIKQKLILRGPMVLSKDKGTVIMAFGLRLEK